jgi:hypothetical protein
MLTLKKLQSIAAKSTNYSDFASQVSAIDPALGETVSLHAQAADGNSPALSEWPKYTLEDAKQIVGMTPEEASQWWISRYSAAV